MHDVGMLVRCTRNGKPDGFEPVADTYEFEPGFRNGQVERVIVIHQPRQGYETIVHIKDKQPIRKSYHEGQWGIAKSDLVDALRQHRCESFTVCDPLV